MNIEGLSFDNKEKWIVTGAAGFIGSHLVDFLLQNNQEVVGIDNFMNGKKENIDFIKKNNSHLLDNFLFFEEDIRSIKIDKLFKGADYVLHQAALGSVPRSFLEPQLFNDININGFINVFNAANAASVKNFVYASSSSVYGDKNNLPQVEDQIGTPLSPYALSKRADEICASFLETSMNVYGLRYFNVFGARQDPNGAYAAVIPKWISGFLDDKDVEINGDGTISRDFCYIDNVVQANILAALNKKNCLTPEILNIAYGSRTTLTELSALIKNIITEEFNKSPKSKIINKEQRKGDILHSYANIDKARQTISYEPTHSVKDGLVELISNLSN
jgi:UDP-N-acetylglucosamine/UDP-N-acetylgalactosamine 4-epimerase